jgi:tetratricopeptide (TPR) repeat protein
MPPVRSLALAALFAFALARPAFAAEDPKDVRAQQLFAESAEAYRAGKFARAIELLDEAYRLSGEPVLLFNLAKAQEGQGDLSGAIASYERYLREAETIPDRGAIEQRLETLRAQVAATEALRRQAEEERKRRELAEQREERSPSPIPWVLAGVGVAGLAVGGTLAGLAGSKEQEVADEDVHVRAARLLDEAERLAIGANVSLAVGGALLVAGVVWGVVDVVVISAPDDKSVTFRVGPSQVELGVAF